MLIWVKRKKKYGEVVFETFSILNSWWLQEVRGCALMFWIYLFKRLELRTTWSRILSQTLYKRCGKNKGSEREKTDQSHLKSHLWRHRGLTRNTTQTSSICTTSKPTPQLDITAWAACSFIQSTLWLLDKQKTTAQHRLPWHQIFAVATHFNNNI